MAISLVASVSKVIGINGPTTTAAFDTTGATAIVLSLAYNVNGLPVISDSKGNTYIGLTIYKHSNSWERLYYCLNPIVGTGHTITVTGSAIYASLWAAAFANVGSYDGRESGAVSAVSPLAPGSVTPSADGALVFTGLNGAPPAVTDTVPSGYTGLGTVPGASGVNYQNSAAYLVQTTAAATNPSWTWTPSRAETVVAVAVFLPIAGPTVARVTQDAVETLSLPFPAARVTQAVVETLGGSTSGLAEGRVTQALTELLQQNPPPTDSRVTQALIEILQTSPPPVGVRVTQLSLDVFLPRIVAVRHTQDAVEVMIPVQIAARQTQSAVELFLAPAGLSRNTQDVVEVFLTLPPCTTGAFPVDDVPAGGSCPAGILD